MCNKKQQSNSYFRRLFFTLAMLLIAACVHDSVGILTMGRLGSYNRVLINAISSSLCTTEWLKNLSAVPFSQRNDAISSIGKLAIVAIAFTKLPTIDKGSQCNLIYTQHTPDICKFLGLDVPAATITSSTVPSISTKTPNSGNGSDSEHPAERVGSIGTILTVILSVTFFVACLGTFAFSPQRRNIMRRCFRRRTTSVRYSRVQSNEEANLLLEPNGHFTDSDDDMLL